MLHEQCEGRIMKAVNGGQNTVVCTLITSFIILSNVLVSLYLDKGTSMACTTTAWYGY